MGNFLKKQNGVPTIEIFYQRINYLLSVSEDTQNAKPYVNHRVFEFILYGKIDQQFMPRNLNLGVGTTLKAVKGANNRSEGTKPIRLVKPVADATAAFLKDYEKAYMQSKINKQDKSLARLKPIKGHVSLTVEYNNHIKKVFELYKQKFMPYAKKKYNYLRTFDDFVKSFIEFSTKYKGIKIVPSTFLMSRDCDPFVSGLMLQVAPGDVVNDQKKYDDFIKSPNSKIFRQLAIKHGFRIDINAPWVLIADVGSSAMGNYLNSYVSEDNISVSGFFNAFYEMTYFQDFPILVNQLVRFYNQFVTNEPRHSYAYENSRSNIVVNEHTRQSISMDELLIDYPPSFWIRNYITLKLNEFPPGTVEQAKIRQLQADCRGILQTSNLTTAIYFVNIELQKYYAVFNGTYYRSLQSDNSEENTQNSNQSAYRSTIIGGTGGSGY